MIPLGRNSERDFCICLMFIVVMRFSGAGNRSGAHVMRFQEALAGVNGLWCTQKTDQCKIPVVYIYPQSLSHFRLKLVQATLFFALTADFRHSLSRNRSKIATAPRRWHKIICASYVKGLAQHALSSRLAYLPDAVPCTTNLVFHYNPGICLFPLISQSIVRFSREICYFHG